MKLTPADLEALINAFEAGQWRELRLRTDEWQLLLSTDTTAQLTTERRAPVLEAGAAPASAAPAPTTTTAPVLTATAPAATAAAARAPAGTAQIPAHWKAVTAPNLGTFYRAPKPGMPPLVEVGQQVQADTELCLIEVMKLFTTLLAGVKGVVRQICVNDAVMVEHGDVLFYIEPN